MKVLGIGDNVCDKYIGMGMMYPGGQALNFAVNAKLDGVSSAYIGVFGNDGVAEHIKGTLDEIGVDRSRCRTYPGENGYAEVVLKDNDRVFVGSNQGGVVRSHPLDLSGDLAYISTFDHVHTSNNGHTDNCLEMIKSCSVTLSYDFSRCWNDEVRLKKVCPFIDFAFISCGGVGESLLDETLLRIAGNGCGHIVATLGKDGSLFFDGAAKYMIEGRAKNTVDSLGAGDAFATGFMLEYLSRFAGAQQHMEKMEYKAAIISCLENGGLFAQRACLGYGAFGYGRKINNC